MQMSAGGSLDDVTWFGRDERLELIKASIDWDAVGARLKACTSRRRVVRRLPTAAALDGRFGAVAAQRFVASRLSRMERRPPDASTICRFRNLVAEAGLASEVFEGLQLERGLVLKQGSITDSTIVGRRGGRVPATGPRTSRNEHEDPLW